MSIHTEDASLSIAPTAPTSASVLEAMQASWPTIVSEPLLDQGPSSESSNDSDDDPSEELRLTPTAQTPNKAISTMQLLQAHSGTLALLASVLLPLSAGYGVLDLYFLCSRLFWSPDGSVSCAPPHVEHLDPSEVFVRHVPEPTPSADILASTPSHFPVQVEDTAFSSFGLIGSTLLEYTVLAILALAFGLLLYVVRIHRQRRHKRRPKYVVVKRRTPAPRMMPFVKREETSTAAIAPELVSAQVTPVQVKKETSPPADSPRRSPRLAKKAIETATKITAARKWPAK